MKDPAIDFVGAGDVLHHLARRPLARSARLAPPDRRHRPRRREKGVHRLAVAAGRADDPAAQELVGETEMLNLVGSALARRVGDAMLGGLMNEQFSAIVRLFGGLSVVRRTTIALDLAMSAAAAWADDDDPALASRGDDFLLRQSACIGGGTIEMAANADAMTTLM